ncbi:hypothetical protein ACWYX1_003107 [Serratia marcescens]
MDLTTQDALDWLNDGIETLKTGEINREPYPPRLHARMTSWLSRGVACRQRLELISI